MNDAPHLGVLEYRDGLVRIGRSEVWRVSVEQVRDGLSRATEKELDALFTGPNGAPNFFRKLNHLKKHFDKRSYAALTWEELSAMIEAKKYKRFDPRWYKDLHTPPLEFEEMVLQKLELGDGEIVDDGGI